MNKQLYDKIISILDANNSRCCDDEEDNAALAKALTSGLSSPCESVPYRQARGHFEAYSRDLPTADFVPGRFAVVKCYDGTVFEVESAFLVRWGNEDAGWICIMAEHYPVMFFPAEDVQDCYTYKLNSTSRVLPRIEVRGFGC